MAVTKIEWTATVRPDGTATPGYTFNPWRGCTKVSAGCANCYAETMSKRNPGVLGIWGPNGTRVIASESGWREPLKWDRAAATAGERRRVFCASMADVFEDWRGPLTGSLPSWSVLHGHPEGGSLSGSKLSLDLVRQRLGATIQATPNLDWLLLTKRPENLARFGEEMFGWDVLRHGFPPNVWLGVSVEDQARADERIPLLLQAPATVRFLSVEPLLGSVDLTRAGFDGRYITNPLTGAVPYRPDLEARPGIDWVIIGGESGPGARPCDAGWIHEIVSSCRDAGVPCFVKQLGSRPYSAVRFSAKGSDRHVEPIPLRDRKGGDPSEWPASLRVRQFPSPRSVPA